MQLRREVQFDGHAATTTDSAEGFGVSARTASILHGRGLGGHASAAVSFRGDRRQFSSAMMNSKPVRVAPIANIEAKVTTRTAMARPGVALCTTLSKTRCTFPKIK